MKRETNSGGAALAVLLLLLSGGCTSSPKATSDVQSSPKASLHSLAGGCAGTVLTDAVPPVWAQRGWSHAEGTPWPVPWAFGTHGDAVAYLFATRLVAVSSPLVDGSSNKVGWVVKDYPSGGNVLVEARPSGQSQPVVTMTSSLTDVPTPGCWTFRLSWSAKGEHVSIINLEVLPTGTNPTAPTTSAP